MLGTYKDFYRFIQMNSPELCELWNDFLNSPDPQKGDIYLYKKHSIIFDRIYFDSEFENGVAFYYIFYKEGTNEEIRIRSINDVNDYSKLTLEDKKDLFRFWKDCIKL